MENFDELTNDQIRDRLKQYGLPIIPVTNTTRKVMVKRLTEAASGVAPKANNKARRETVNVPKVTVDDSGSDTDAKRSKPKPTPANRRATIAASSVAPPPVAVVEKVIAKPKPVPVVNIEKLPAAVSPVKKSGRTTPSVPNSIVANVPEQSDDDVVPSIVKPNRRTSRSPSLGKSTVVTTSYKHTIESLPEQSFDNNDDDVVLVYDEDSDGGVNDKFNGAGKKTPKKSTAFGGGDTNVSRRVTLDTFRTTITPGPVQLTEFRDQAKDSLANNDSLFRRRTTYTPSKPQFESSGDEENADPLQNVQTPFLSDFTRRLAHLKAEPLPGLRQQLDFDDSSVGQRTDHYRPSAYAGRSSVGRSQYSRTGKSLVAAQQEPSAWKKWEQKIRLPLLVLLGLFVCVFLYVFLFTN